MMSTNQAQPKAASMLVIDADQSSVQKLKQAMKALHININTHYKNLEEWTAKPPFESYQILWIDLPESETLFAGDWLDYLISQKRLTPKQLLILVCHDNQILQLAMDYPHHNIICLEYPWSLAIAEKSIHQFFRYFDVLQPIQGLANVMRHNDSLKLTTYQLSKQQDPVLLRFIQKIHQHLLAENRQLGALKAGENPLSWETWLHFRQSYHNQSVDACIDLLQKPGQQFNKYSERQDSYLIYLNLLKADITAAFNIASHIPLQKQTSRLLRLIHLTALLAGQYEFANTVLVKKRRLHGGQYANLLCDLMEARAIAYVGHQMLLKRQPLPAHLKQRLQQLTATVVNQEHNQPAFYEMMMLRAELALFNGDLSEAKIALEQCPWQGHDLLMVPVLCHAALLAVATSQDDLSRQMLWSALATMLHAPESCQRIFALCLVQQTIKMLPSRTKDLAALHRQFADTTDIWALAEFSYFCAIGPYMVQDLRNWVKPLGFNRWH